ncbi:MAG: hypothetical protein KBT53_05065 [Porticoccus sp.]|nr:hypothetical protein [Porticoccus sp.]MBQ0806879.1 hypothetical protein [Porticoccus sp.]
MKHEGEVALESSFNIFGQVAAQELFTNPDVAAGMAGLEKYLGENKINKILIISE